MHAAHPETSATTLYAAPIIFDRNAHKVQALVRVADVLWCAAGLSGQYEGSTIRPPTSVYSIPLELADRVGGWDTDNEAIGEDLHMYLKCFFAMNGHLTTRTVLSPVSQSNVSSGVSGWNGKVDDIKARYQQAIRHMWGALDSGFGIRETVKVWRNRKTTTRTFRPLHTRDVPDEDGVLDDVIHDTIETPNWPRISMLLHRLFEAHFLPTHTAILIVASGIYEYMTSGRPDPLGVNWVFVATTYLRSYGFFITGLYILFYERYHKVCVTQREQEMKAAGLAEHMKGSFSHRSIQNNLLDYAIFPLVAPLYGSIPALQAQLSQFWTLDLVYAVSLKPPTLRLPKKVEYLLPGKHES